MTFTVESASGWQEAALAAGSGGCQYDVRRVLPAPAGHYAVSEGYFGTATTNGPLTALAGNSDGPNGVYTYGAGDSRPSVGIVELLGRCRLQHPPDPAARHHEANRELASARCERGRRGDLDQTDGHVQRRRLGRCHDVEGRHDHGQRHGVVRQCLEDGDLHPRPLWRTRRRTPPR